MESGLLRAHEFFRRGPVSDGGLEPAHREGSRLGVVLPRALAARQGRALDARRELHRLVLLERVRQGRADHVGVAGGRLPVDRAGHARVRAARLPARARRSPGTRTRRSGCKLPVRARQPARDVPRGARAARRPGRRVGGDRRRSRAAARSTSAARPGRLRARVVGRGDRADRRRARAHDQALRPRPGGRLLADPGDVDGLLRRRARASCR